MDNTINPRLLDIRASAAGNTTSVNGGAPAIAPQTLPMAQGWQHQPMPAGMPTGMPAFNVVNITAQNNIPMGYAGHPQPMHTGMPFNMPHNHAAPFPAAPHDVPMGHAGQYQPVHAGMNFNMPFNNAAPFPAPAQHNVAMGHAGQHMPMHAGMPLGMPFHNAAPLRAAPHNIPMGYAGLVQPMHAGMPFNMPAFNAAAAPAAPAAPRPAAPIPAAQGVYNAPVPNDMRPFMPMGHSAAQPIVLDDAPSPQGAGTKRASPDSTAVQSAPKAKKPRFGKVEVAKLPPTTPIQSAVLPTPPNSKGPAPAKPAPREKRADPHNLLGAMHYTHVTKPANRMLPQAAQGLEKAENIERPIYSQQREGKARSKSRVKVGGAASSSAVVGKKSSPAKKLKPASDKQSGAATSSPVVEEEPLTPEANPDLEADSQAALDESDSEEDAPGSPNLEAGLQAAFDESDSEEHAEGSSVASEASIEDDEDDSTSEDDELAVNDDGWVIVDAEGMPMYASVYRAQQEAEAATRSLDVSLVLEEPWESEGANDSGEVSEREEEEFYYSSSDGEISEEE